MDSLGTTVFCDDIRFEQNNKLTLVGCYGPDLMFDGDFPLLLPKLGVFVQVRLPKGSPPLSELLIYLPGQTEQQAVRIPIGSPSDASVAALQSPLADADLLMILSTNVPVVFNMIEVTEPGLIKVRAICGDTVIKCGTLRISRTGAPTVAQHHEGSSGSPEMPRNKAQPMG